MTIDNPITTNNPIYHVGPGWHSLVDEGIRRLEAAGAKEISYKEKYGLLMPARSVKKRPEKPIF
ncbi:hypothetical protein JQM66_09145 [Oscillibacter valericigenes]|uniref:hypothetical protein n=1 Tax=Oscillibacter valericigenes TaxID=351091 RepID=UPI001F182091|nr:hypothetical protein [Oscillibacter valericigenes]MCF2664725.1 hypothetical protein [Oscillibacter valericigenes]